MNKTFTFTVLKKEKKEKKNLITIRTYLQEATFRAESRGDSRVGVQGLGGDVFGRGAGCSLVLPSLFLLVSTSLTHKSA